MNLKSKLHAVNQLMPKKSKLRKFFTETSIKHSMIHVNIAALEKKYNGAKIRQTNRWRA